MLLTVVDQRGKERKRNILEKDAYSGFLRVNATLNTNGKELF